MSDLPQHVRDSPATLFPRTPAPAALADLLAELAAAGSVNEVASAVVRHAAALNRARGSALAVPASSPAAVQIIASVGYDCDSMSPGALLPLDAGLPLTEAARTGRSVVQTSPDGGWVAVPLAPGGGGLGALLVSLTAASRGADIELLAALAGHARLALERVGAFSRVAPQPVSVQVRPAGLDIAVHCQALYAGGGGDLVEVFAPSSDVAWVLVADVCGFDETARRLAASVSSWVRPLATASDDPAKLLTALEASLVAVHHERHVTALALRLVEHADRSVTVQVASAGHPMPIAVTAAGAEPLAPESHIGLPLNLGLGDWTEPTVSGRLLHSGDAFVAFTDGVIDRNNGSVADDILRAMCERTVGFADAATSLDLLLDVLAGAEGASRDDVAAVMVRVPR